MFVKSVQNENAATKKTKDVCTAIRWKKIAKLWIFKSKRNAEFISYALA